MNELNLPRTRRTNASVKTPSETGVWTEVDRLKDVAGDLEVPPASIDMDRMKSVPHMWGRVKIFEAALVDEGHPAHADAVAKWRGLLLLLALRREEDGFGVVSRPLTLSDTAEFGESVRRFLELADTERPARTIDPLLDWSTVYLLFASGRGSHETLLGMLSPGTIVVPARDYTGSENLPQLWARGAITDPLSIDGALSPDQIAVCATYVETLAKCVRSLDASGDRLSSAVLVQLRNLLEDLRAAEKGRALAKPTSSAGSQLVPDAPAKSLYQAVNQSWKRGAIEGVISDCRIKPSPEALLPRVFSGALLADPTIAATLEADRAHLSLFNTCMLSETDKFDAAQREADERENGYLILRVEDILCGALAPLNGVSARSHPSDFRSHLLPLTPAALLLAPMEELKKRIRMVQEEPGRVTVQLDLEIESRDRSTTKTHTIMREYVRPGVAARTEGAGLLLQDASEAPADPPLTFAAWPNFASESWKWNFLTAHSESVGGAVLTSGVSARILARDLEPMSKPADRRARLLEWASPSGRWGDITDKAGPDNAPWFRTVELMRPRPSENSFYSKRLQWSEHPFEAGLFTVSPRAAKLEGNNPVYAGVGALEPAKAPNLGSTSADIAIDFGTTNTTIYHRIEDRHAEGMVFKERLRRFAETEYDDAEVDYVAFMPPREVEQPFATVAQMREPSVGDMTPDQLFRDAEKAVLWRDYAFFDTSVQHMVRAIFEPRERGRLKFNLKWDPDPKVRAMVERYIGHLAVLSLAELFDQGVPPSKVRWWFSYPMSMDNQARDFQTLVRGIIPDLSSVGREEVRFRTESDAALAYFENQIEMSAGTMVVLDIGGGTTDLALAIQGRPIWRHSVRLAGGDLMIGFLLKNRDFIKLLNLDGFGEIFTDETHSKNFLKGIDAAKPSLAEIDIANAIVNSKVFRDAFEQRYAYFSGTETYQRLRAGGYLMISGVLYYLGMQVRALLANGEIDEDFISELDNPRVCFAGRGATLYKSLGHGETADPDFDDVLKMFAIGMQREEAALDPPAFSRQPKHEAAEGMLSGGGEDRETSSNLSRVLGAAVEYRGGDAEAAAAGPMSTMADVSGVEPSGVSLETFNEFLETLRTVVGLEIDISAAKADLPIKALKEMKEAVETKSTGGLESANPPFIAMLKQTLSLLYTGEKVNARWLTGDRS